MTLFAGMGPMVRDLQAGDPVAWAVLIAAVLVGWVLIPLAVRRVERRRGGDRP